MFGLSQGSIGDANTRMIFTSEGDDDEVILKKIQEQYEMMRANEKEAASAYKEDHEQKFTKRPKPAKKSADSVFSELFNYLTQRDKPYEKMGEGIVDEDEDENEDENDNTKKLFIF